MRRLVTQAGGFDGCETGTVKQSEAGRPESSLHVFSFFPLNKSKQIQAFPGSWSDVSSSFSGVAAADFWTALQERSLEERSRPHGGIT